MKKHSGFTLVELVIVIVVLGILASFVIPRFASIDKEARIAVVEGLGGSLRSAAAISHSVSLTQRKAQNASITMDGQDVTMINFYPTGDVAGIVAALASSPSDFNITYVAGPPATATFASKGAASNCQVVYTAAVVGEGPGIVTTTSGC